MTGRFINSIYRLTCASIDPSDNAAVYRLSIQLSRYQQLHRPGVRNPVTFIFGSHSLPLIARNICPSNQKQTFRRQFRLLAYSPLLAFEESGLFAINLSPRSLRRGKRRFRARKQNLLIMPDALNLCTYRTYRVHFHYECVGEYIIPYEK